MATFNGENENLRFSCGACDFKSSIDIDPTSEEDMKKLGEWLLTHSQYGGVYSCIKKDTGKERFYAVYASLPLNERNNVCCVIDNEPMTWRLCKGYIDTRALIAEKILKALDELKVI